MTDKGKNTMPFLELRQIEKVFGNTIALDKMNFEVHKGEILGLVGPNGAGKSTLMKIITGVYAPTSGQIYCNGESMLEKTYTANESKELGIACAYQELSLCTNINTYENFLVSQMNHSFIGKHKWRREGFNFTRQKLDEIFPVNGIDIKESVSELMLYQKQMVEISKAMSVNGLKLLILDEPTSSLNGERINQLHTYMRKLCDSGISIIYISHKLDEISQICDRVTVMRSGKNVLTKQVEDLSSTELVEVMGGKINGVRESETEEFICGETVVEINNFSDDTLKDINLNIHKGEIIGVSGLAGSGQKELLSAIFEAAHGKNKRNIKLSTKVSFVSGDRNNEGLFPFYNIADNILVSSYEQVTSGGLINKRKFSDLAQFWYDKLKFKAEGIEDDITSLSGGNQQKALIARGICADAGIIILNDPTCGVDIETKQGMYHLLKEARENGTTIIWHSTEDMEMEQCDRLLIMHEGRIVEKLTGSDVTVSNIVATSFEHARKSNADDAQKAELSVKKNNSLSKILSKIIRNRATLPIVVMLAIFAMNASMNPRIASYTGIRMMYSSAIPLVFIALGQMFMVISGGIDMGNGLAVGLTNVIFAFIITQSPALGLLGIAIFIVAYGALGALIYIKRIPAIVVTLGASFIWRGIGLILAPYPGGVEPAFIKTIFEFKCPLIPTPILISIVAAFATWYFLKRSKYGLIIIGNGNNPTAIARAGWSKLWAVIITYMVSGLMVVIAGMAMTAISNGGDINSTASYQMLSIATIILGGCAFVGGIASPIGVTAAALGISSISTLLTMLNVDSNLQSAVTGLILIGALAIKLVQTGRRHKN